MILLFCVMLGFGLIFFSGWTTSIKQPHHKNRRRIGRHLSRREAENFWLSDSTQYKRGLDETSWQEGKTSLKIKRNIPILLILGIGALVYLIFKIWPYIQ